MKIKCLLILCLILISCGIDRDERNIDFQKSERIIPFMDDFSINKLELRQGNLVINDTLLQLSGEPESDYGWTAHQMKMEEWVKNRETNEETITDLIKLMMDSNNVRIVREKGVFFFNEGSWIDADWGKAYSLNDISSKKADFSFDQVQEIKAINDPPNWYEYYAD